MPWQIIFVAFLAKMERDTIRICLTACEYLQIDPSVAYDLEFIEKRAELALSQWNKDDDPNERRELISVVNEYLKKLRAGPDGNALRLDGNVRLGRPGTGTHAFQSNMFWSNSEIPKGQTMTVPELHARKFSKLIEDGKLKILPGTVSVEYVKKRLRHENYDNYIDQEPKWAAQQKMKYV